MSEQKLMSRWAARIEAWPRLLRIILTMLISAALVLLAWLVLVELIGGGVTNTDPSPALTLMVPVLGLLVYAVCWSALVGFKRPGDKTWHAGPSAPYFLLAGLLSLVAIIVIVVILLT